MNKVICGDSIIEIKKIEDDSVHLILSDIPYGISYDQWDVLHDNKNSGLLGSSPAQKKSSIFKKRGKPLNGWSEADKKISIEYYDWCCRWAPDWYRVLKGPDAVLQHSCVNFHWVKLGERREQTLWIENQSDCQAHFQFDIDCQESVFSIRPAFGTLAGKTRMTLHCAYQPTHPIISFRRVACLIHHQVSDGEGTKMWGGGPETRR